MSVNKTAVFRIIKNTNKNNEISKTCSSSSTELSSHTMIRVVKNENYKEFKCIFKECQKKFLLKWHLERHLKTHCYIKRFICNLDNCSKEYKSKENMVLHIKNIHLLCKPYNCSFCSNTFSHRNGKTYHERKVHTHIFPHKCAFNGNNI
jgi:uncharacterized Zn-finger protein